MAKPIEMMPTPRNAREDLKRKLDNAPLEHADALLDGYELLQQLHETGTLDVLRGALGAGDQVVRHAVALAATPESVRALRNLLVLGKVLGSVDPEVLTQLLSGIPAVMEKKPEEKPPSLFAIFKRMTTTDARRGLAVAVSLLQALGGGPGRGKTRD